MSDGNLNLPKALSVITYSFAASLGHAGVIQFPAPTSFQTLRTDNLVHTALPLLQTNFSKCLHCEN